MDTNQPQLSSGSASVMIVLLALLFSLSMSAKALPAASQWSGAPLKLDGKLDDDGWQSAAVFSDFVPTAASGKTTAEVATSFRIAYDAEGLYIGVECAEPRMAALDMTSGLWICDGVEFFFCPSGKDDEFYQFRVNANGLDYAMFYAECGATKPDAYAPIWEHAVALRDDGWSIEVRLPWRAFYMTNARAWSDTWKLNIARNRRVARQDISWSRLRDDFLESKYYRSMGGFPVRKPAEDLYIQNASMRVDRVLDGKYTGPMTVMISAQNPGEYLLSCTKGDELSIHQPVSLKSGLNQIVLPKATFTTTGRQEVCLRLTQKKGDIAAERRFSVPVAYQPVQVTLTSPCYRNTFYPGEKSDQIAGSITLSDPAIPGVMLTIDDSSSIPVVLQDGKGEFMLPTRHLTDGIHTLAVSTAERKPQLLHRIAIHKFSHQPEGRRSAWVHHGWLYIDGRPVLPRLLYAHYYHGGKALDEKSDRDDLGLSGVDGAFRRVIEPKRLIPDIEFREATTDVQPCQQMIDKMRAAVERFRTQDFVYYYFADEPECREVSPVYLRHLYDFIKELDPWHPVLITTRAPARYMDCADILVTHPYSGPMFDGKGGRFLTVPVHRIRDYAREVVDARRLDKVAGMMNQFFSYRMNSIFADYPTFEELESQTWSSLANQVRFFYPYAYHDIGDRPVLYEGLRYLMTSLRALEFITLSGSCRTIANSSPAECDSALLTHGNLSLLVVVNLMPKPLTVTIEDRALTAIPQWHLFRENAAPVPGSRSKIDFRLAPYQCILYTSEPIGTTLPTRSDTLRKIAALEQERLSRPNLLVNQGHRIEINCSNMPRNAVGLQNKLFDGTRDTFAWDNEGARNTPAFMDLSFTQKLVPTFRKLRIYGTPLNKEISVSIRKRGEWQKLTPSAINQSAYMIEFCYPSPLRTIRLRIDFPDMHNELLQLYEIELEP